MANRALIMARTNYGLGRAGAIIGYQVAQYRPTSAGPVVASGNLLGTITADFDNRPDLEFAQQPKIGAFMFFLLGDPTTLAVGDYLVGQGTGQGEAETFFVAAVGGVEPAMCIRCNATFSVTRPSGGTQVGANPPGGDAEATETAVLTGWPGSVLLGGGRADKGTVDLPGDVRMAGWTVLLPILPAGVVIRSSDILTDPTGLRRIVSGAELTPAGYRIQAVQEAT